jgi:hypothetical protein
MVSCATLTVRRAIERCAIIAPDAQFLVFVSIFRYPDDAHQKDGPPSGLTQTPLLHTQLSLTVFLRISEKVVLMKRELTFGYYSTDDSACRLGKQAL